MPLIIPANTLSGGYEVANSCRFNDGDSAYMHKTPGSAGNLDRWTFSAWIKKCSNGLDQGFLGFWVDSSNYFVGRFRSDDLLAFGNKDGGSWTTELIPNAVYRDNSAWYHIVFQYDSGQASSSNRASLWVNGVKETSFAASVYPSQNADTKIPNSGNPIVIGRTTKDSSTYYLDGYMAEVCFIDGTAYAASDFGEFDEDSPTIWKPKNVSGLTFGTNGFYLDFEDSANLGNDANGGTDLTEVNLAATDQSTDTPTLNYSTFNPLDNTYGQGTFSEGNLKIVTSSSLYCTNTSTFNLTKGKWHFEVKVGDSNGKNCIGIAGATTPHVSGDSTLAFGDSANEYSYTASGEFRHSGSSTGSWGSSFTNGDIIGCAFDLDNNELFFYKNGTIQNSGTAYSITDPTSTLTGGYFVGAGDFASDNTSTMEYNFGSPSYSISSGNTDANGHGNFEYPVKSGHYAINSANLAEFG